jgi:hypothetical protein
MLLDFRWLTDLSPWLQGLFGGAGITLLWEGFLKPGRDRRSLAHVLAEELSLTVQYAAGQRLYIKHNPKGMPGDFAICDAVFTAVAPRLGELPDLVGEIVLFYHGVRDLNRLPALYADALDQYRRGKPPEQAIHDRQMDSVLGVYRTGLEKCVERANALLPKLRRASIPWYRIDLRLRKPKVLSLDSLARDVDELARIRKQQLRGQNPQ